MMHINTIKRIKKVQEITLQHYEIGNQKRCYRAVWREFVYPIYPMSYKTYLRYINYAIRKH